MSEEMKIRLTSPAAWAIFIAQLLTVLPLFLSEGNVTVVRIVALAVLEVLTVFGILNNPTTREKF